MIEARDEHCGPFRPGERRGGVEKDHGIDTTGHRQQHAAEPGEFCSDRLHDDVSFMPARCHGILI